MLGTKCATCEHISLKIFFDEELQDYQYIVACKADGPLYAVTDCDKYEVRKQSLLREEI